LHDSETKQGFAQITELIGGEVARATDDELDTLVEITVRGEWARAAPEWTPSETSGCEAAVQISILNELMFRPRQEQLIVYLSSMCFEFVGQSPIELEMVQAEARGGVQDGLVLLIDAFERANGEPRDCLRRSIDRAFLPYVPMDGEVNQWLLHCRAWWKSNKARVSINDQYAQRVLFNEAIDAEHGLFTVSK
jgi:hypothetical protein